MTTTEFTAWLAAMYEQRGWIQKDCALALGVQQRQITRWKEHKSPRYIGLACAAIVAGMEPWTIKTAL